MVAILNNMLDEDDIFHTENSRAIFGTSTTCPIVANNQAVTFTPDSSHIYSTVGIEGNGGANWFSSTQATTTITGDYSTATGGLVYLDNTATTATTFTNDNYYTVTNNTDGVLRINFQDKKRTLRNHIKGNLLIKSVSRSLERSISLEEQKARDSLRDLITEKDWRRYVTNGFIMVKGEHYWYQIFNRGNIGVFHKGKKTHSICIHTDKSCPPTDHVLNMKILAEIDERQIWRGGNVHTLNAESMPASWVMNSERGTLLELSRMLA